ncbi:hypothetical protein [Streptomyces xantholiticus]|uniref:Uncharacterized protein n=1 Tax=Streptomyces xantholiticus TaxID=68285 RepID=A0ABV1V349_9ACTN
MAGGWWLVAGGWWLVAGGWWLVAGGRWPVAAAAVAGQLSFDSDREHRLCAERAVDALNAGFGLRHRGPRGDPSEDRLNACTSS